jgi:WD40 repeat protein
MGSAFAKEPLSTIVNCKDSGNAYYTSLRLSNDGNPYWVEWDENGAFFVDGNYYSNGSCQRSRTEDKHTYLVLKLNDSYIIHNSWFQGGLIHSSDGRGEEWIQKVEVRLSYGDYFEPRLDVVNGNKVLLGNGKCLMIYDLYKGKNEKSCFEEIGTFGIWTARFSLDGNHIVASADFNTIIVKNLLSGDTKIFKQPSSATSFSPNGTEILSRYDKSLMILNKDTGTVKKKFDFQEIIRSAQFSPDSKSILLVMRDGRAITVDAVSGKKLFEIKHDRAIIAAIYGKSANTVFTVTGNGVGRTVTLY